MYYIYSFECFVNDVASETRLNLSREMHETICFLKMIFLPLRVSIADNLYTRAVYTIKDSQYLLLLAGWLAADGCLNHSLYTHRSTVNMQQENYLNSKQATPQYIQKKCIYVYWYLYIEVAV